MKKLVILALVVLLGGSAAWFGLPKYRHWKQDRLLARADEDLRKGDLKSAALRAREVLALNISNVGASRLMAEVLETLNPARSLEWRQRVVELAPSSVADRLELARCASMQGENALAIKALQGVGGTNLNTSAYNSVAALVAAGLGDLPLAEHHLSEALRLDPTNRLIEINAAVIHLQATNQQVVAEAVQTLEELTLDPVYRSHALRMLVMEAVRANDLARADAFSAELTADAQAPLEDFLVRLEVLKQESSADFAPMLDRLESRCAADPNEINSLAEWLLDHQMADAAARWLDGLPAAAQHKLPVEMARADCFISQRDWTGMATALSAENWSEGEFLRQAMLARAYRGQGLDFQSQSDWLSAVQTASERASYLSTLVRLVNKWGWNKEREDLLWLMVQKFPAEKWAMDMLNQIYVAAGDTRGLQKVNDMIVTYDAGNYVAKNNLAMALLLLNSQVAQAEDLAAQTYAHDPANPDFAATQAYSLYLQGKTAEALKVMEALKPAALEEPSRALYYGLMLAASGQREKAGTYFAIAGRGKLLPEESALLAQATGKN